MTVSRTSALLAVERAKRNGWSILGISREIGFDRDRLRRFLMGIGVTGEAELVARLCHFGAKLLDDKRPIAADRVHAKEASARIDSRPADAK
jgi:hypothetical protein